MSLKDELLNALALEFVQEAEPYVEPETVCFSDSVHGKLVLNRDGSLTHTAIDGIVIRISSDMNTLTLVGGL